ncbi:MAG: cation:proton antiporter [Alkalibacterium sp.]|uniref:cation:proton antiporter n=1 Tax=Alkalibacterium sp. TaxID=1872447 RepID=UPI00264A4296|nr:cation:proton antiporter [Alkalibacterium sp.]MDN6296187.1 cation:proton antiporter [Alkalibacterium sp.]MDN6398514.1 cation:proton antiporter [Alkalibacterium sp.]
MLTSIALVFLVGMFLGWLFKKLGLPSLVGMIITGILLGPYAFNALDDSLLTISADLRQMALVIILFRAGLSLKLDDFKKMGSSAIFMSFVPALFEIIGVLLLGSILFDLSLVELAVMGSVLAAVSPAVVVPSMLHVIEEGYGQEKRVPQLILAGASMDDIFVVVLFSSFLALALGGDFSAMNILEIPLAIIMGIIIGSITGWFAQRFYRRFHMRDTSKVIMLLSLSFLLLEFEELIAHFLPFSGLLAIMALGLTINQFYPKLAHRLALKYNKLWTAAQILLFVLVGASVDITYALKAGVPALLLIIGALVIRMVGVLISLLPSSLDKKEKLFAMISFTPKATVQAAIGGIPLAMGLERGQLILTVAVLAILITAPLGSFAIEQTYKKLLNKSTKLNN